MPEKRSVAITIENNEAPPEKMTLMQRWKLHYRNSPNKMKNRCAKYFRMLMIFQIISQLYTSNWYITPYVFQEYSDQFRYFFQVFVVYLCIQGTANWICTICYDTSWDKIKAKDRPYLNRSPFDKPPDQFIPALLNNNQHDIIPEGYIKDDKCALPWKYCEECDVPSPPRCHHCHICQKCILKRDHHCFLVGVCIGLHNQRYFTMLAFYAAVVGLLGLYLTRLYLFGHGYEDMPWSDLFPGNSIWKYLMGEIELHTLLMLVHVPLMTVFGPIGVFYFIGQMVVIALGKTVHEMQKSLPVKITTSLSHNMRAVFGDFWGLNFFFPAQLFFKTKDDGMNWEGMKMYGKTRGRAGI